MGAIGDERAYEASEARMEGAEAVVCRGYILSSSIQFNNLWQESQSCSDR